MLAWKCVEPFRQERKKKELKCFFCYDDDSFKYKLESKGSRVFRHLRVCGTHARVRSGADAQIFSLGRNLCFFALLRFLQLQLQLKVQFCSVANRIFCAFFCCSPSKNSFTEFRASYSAQPKKKKKKKKKKEREKENLESGIAVERVHFFTPHPRHGNFRIS